MRGKTIALLAAFLLLLSGVAFSTTAEAKAPAAPRNAKVTVQVGQVTVSWTKLTATGVAYQVTSLPAGKTCTVVDQDHCTFAIGDSTRWRFQVTATTQAGTSPPTAPTKFYKQRTLLIVAGQSNALGYGSFAVDPDTRTNYYQAPYRNGADSASTITWAHLSLIPMPADHPVKLSSPQIFTLADGSQRRIFGPELSLARDLYANHKLAVTFVKATWGGTSLAYYWDVHRSDSLFWQLVDHYNVLVQADAAKGQLDTLGMIYWYQGEHDMVTPADADAYQANLVDLVSNLRGNLLNGANARVALVKAWISPLINLLEFFGADPATVAAYREGHAKVRAADDWAAANIPGVNVAADVSDLPFSANDPAHLTNIGEIALGHRLATATAPLIP